MWSGPRNISTALMRSFENRDDCFVTDEPFYAFFLNETGQKHPMSKEIIQSEEKKYKKIVEYLTGSIPHSKTIWYQKHMAHHMIPESDLEWIKKMNNCLLIRNPKDVICSYIKRNEINSINDLGYPQQIGIYNMLKESLGTTPTIIDANELLANPEQLLIKLCRSFNITFDKDMLSWPKGPRSTDGVWGKHWYIQVESSTGFKPHIDKKNVVPKKYDYIYNQCMEHYNLLYKNRMRLS